MSTNLKSYKCESDVRNRNLLMCEVDHIVRKWHRGRSLVADASSTESFRFVVRYVQ